jgi:ribosome-interacting GTPase 1
MNALTGAGAEAADYPYTTLTPNIGMWNLGAFAFELIDLPPVPEGSLDEVHYAAGLKEAVVNADLLCLVVSLDADPAARVGALNGRLAEMGVAPQFAPVSESRGGTPSSSSEGGSPRGAVVVGTRADVAGGDALEALARLVPEASVFEHPMDAPTKDELAAALCRFLDKIIVVARDPSAPDEPLRYAVPAGATVLDLATHIHKELAESARKGKVWGPSAKFPGQEVGLDHVLRPGDVVEIYSR